MDRRDPTVAVQATVVGRQMVVGWSRQGQEDRKVGEWIHLSSIWEGKETGLGVQWIWYDDARWTYQEGLLGFKFVHPDGMTAWGQGFLVEETAEEE